MAKEKEKKVEEVVEKVPEIVISHVSEDYGREDLNQLGRAVNALIDKYEGK